MLRLDSAAGRTQDARTITAGNLRRNPALRITESATGIWQSDWRGDCRSEMNLEQPEGIGAKKPRRPGLATLVRRGRNREEAEKDGGSVRHTLGIVNRTFVNFSFRFSHTLRPRRVDLCWGLKNKRGDSPSLAHLDGSTKGLHFPSCSFSFFSTRSRRSLSRLLVSSGFRSRAFFQTLTASALSPSAR